MNRDERLLIRCIYRTVYDIRSWTVRFIHTVQMLRQIRGPDIINRYISF